MVLFETEMDGDRGKPFQVDPSQCWTPLSPPIQTSFGEVPQMVCRGVLAREVAVQVVPFQRSTAPALFTAHRSLEPVLKMSTIGSVAVVEYATVVHCVPSQ